MTSKQRNSASIWFKIAIFFPCVLIFFSFTPASNIRAESFNGGRMDLEVFSKELVDFRTVMIANVQNGGINAGNGRSEGGNKFRSGSSKSISSVSERSKPISGDDSKKNDNGPERPKDVFAEDIVHWFPLVVAALFIIYWAYRELSQSKTQQGV